MKLKLERKRPILGVNYWPRKRGVYMWKEFNEEEIVEELQQMKSLGIELARVFLIWEDFQPYPDTLNGSSLEKLRILLDLAREEDIKVMISIFQGHMSGVNWLPPWACSPEPHTKYLFMVNGKLEECSAKNLYSDPFMLRAEELLIKELALRFGKHPALYGWDIANEVDNVLVPSTAEEFENWVKWVSQTIRSIDPSHPITLGTHAENLELNRNVSLRKIAPHLDFLSMHGYPTYSQNSTSPLDPFYFPSLYLLTLLLGEGEEVASQEIGLPVAPKSERGSLILASTKPSIPPQRVYLASEEEGRAYYENLLRILSQLGTIMIVPWCFSDFSEELWERPPYNFLPHERWFGLTRADGSLKSTGKALKEFAESLEEDSLQGEITVELSPEVEELLEVYERDHEKGIGELLNTLRRAIIDLLARK